MVFEWDAEKARVNRVKHGVTFHTAQRVFADPHHLSRQDRIEGGEQRWQTLGVVDGVAFIVVAHLWWDDGLEEHVRIISARSATREERAVYVSRQQD